MDKLISPVPWTTNADGTRVIAADGYEVCSTPNLRIAGWYLDDPHVAGHWATQPGAYIDLKSGEEKANAALIAAAPDLLAACRAQHRLIADMARFVGGMSLRDYGLFNDAPAMAERAMAKASGKA